MTKAAKQYMVRFYSLMGAYAILLIVSMRLLGQEGLGSWKIPVALMPVLPLLFAVWVAYRFVVRMDEMQKAIHTEAVTFSFLLTVVITLTYGFLENAGAPNIPLFYVPVLQCVLWGIGAAIATRRYR